MREGRRRRGRPVGRDYSGASTPLEAGAPSSHQLRSFPFVAVLTDGVPMIFQVHRNPLILRFVIIFPSSPVISGLSLCFYGI